MPLQPNDTIYPLYQRDTPEQWSVTHGLTLREHVGVMALQGLIAHYGYGGDASAENAAELAHWAVNLADAFIQELNQ